MHTSPEGHDALKRAREKFLAVIDDLTVALGETRSVKRLALIELAAANAKSFRGLIEDWLAEDSAPQLAAQVPSCACGHPLLVVSPRPAPRHIDEAEEVLREAADIQEFNDALEFQERFKRPAPKVVTLEHLIGKPCTCELCTAMREAE